MIEYDHFMLLLPNVNCIDGSGVPAVTARVVGVLNVTKGHTFSLLDKSMNIGLDDPDTILFQNCNVSNLKFGCFHQFWNIQNGRHPK